MKEGLNVVPGVLQDKGLVPMLAKRSTGAGEHAPFWGASMGSPIKRVS